MDLSLRIPFRSLHNKLAIIFGSPVYYRDGQEDTVQVQQDLLLGLEGAGLTRENSIVWPIDFGVSTRIDPDQFSLSI